MNIGYVVQQLYPNAYGSGVHAFELARELGKLGHEVHIITKGNPAQKKVEQFQKLTIHRILNNFQTSYYFPGNSFLLWKLGKGIVKRLDLQILLGHGFESSLYFTVKKKIPFVYKAAGTIALQRPNKFRTWRNVLRRLYFPILGKLEQIAIQNSDFVIAISDSIKRELTSNLKIPEKKVIRIYNGVNLKRFSPSRDYSTLKTELGLDSKKIILFVGRMSPNKCPQLLMRAIPPIIKKFPECVFLFVGDGPIKSYLQAMVKNFHLSQNVRVLGFVPNSEIPKYFAMADLCVIPSLYEPFGLVALESIASGTPILTSAQGGLAEIHELIPEFPLIKSLNPQTIKNQIESLISNPEELSRLGGLGRKRISQEFTWAYCAKQTSKILKVFLEKKKKN